MKAGYVMHRCLVLILKSIGSHGPSLSGSEGGVVAVDG
jgi:hypothetical protein